MQKIIQKNIKQRKLFYEFEKKKLILKVIYKNNLFDNRVRMLTREKMFLISKNSSITRIKNRCILTGRGKRVFRMFKLTRHQLKEKSLQGYLPGVSKISW